MSHISIFIMLMIVISELEHAYSGVWFVDLPTLETVTKSIGGSSWYVGGVLSSSMQLLSNICCSL